MVTSAVQGEGKTTVAVDLAVALARSGRSVALVDLDARAPRLSAAVGLDQRLRRGLADVVANGDPLDGVLVDVPLSSTPEHFAPDAPAEPVAQQRWNPGGSRIGRRSSAAASTSFGTDQGGRLQVLTFGSRRPADPGDFVGSASVRRVVDELASEHDIVVIDTPPLLPVSDARAISEYADAALIVCGLRTSRRRNLRALRKLLGVLPTAVLGVVVTGTPQIPGYGYDGDPAAYARADRDVGRLDHAPR
jgi:Mrp family chromosome partitioning ATPase